MNNDGRQILIVEDENVVSLDLRDSLIRLGFQVTDRAATGQQAIDSVQKLRPDLVLMDIRLRGDMDGIQAADHIRRHFDLPVVYVTAYSDQDTLQRAQVTEPYGYLLKPFDERELNAVIEMSLFRHRARQAHDKLLAEQSARAAIENEHRWVQFLAEAGERLSASLDLDETLDAVMRLTVPYLADLATVQLRDGETTRTVVVHHAGHQEALIWELLLPPSDNGLLHRYARVIRTGEPELRSLIGDDELTAATGDAEDLRLLRVLRPRGFICVPLVMRGQAFGALTLLTAESNRVYDGQDFSRAMELARRCASAIDNATLYQKAQQAISLRNDFLSVAAHELRTPLAAAMLGLQNMERSVRRTDDQALVNRIEKILQQLENLNELVERLLDVSRMDAGHLEIEPEELELPRLVREVTSRFEDSARRAGSSLQVRLPPSLVGSWDSIRLDQVLTNLLANAVKFCSGTPIEVSLEGDDATARLTVRDGGIGIPKDKLPHIFDRFERGVSVRNYGGLGLGLYVARQLVEAHGGRIRVESESGQGAAFIVELPRRSVTKEKSGEPAAAAPRSRPD